MESAFQFTNPALSGLEFWINKKFNSEKDTKIQIRMNMSVKVAKEENRNEALVELDVEIGEKNDDIPFYIKAIEGANFRWNDELDDNMIEKLLNQNAPSLLLSYLRPIVAQVTSASKYGTYNCISFACKPNGCKIKTVI